MSCNFMPCKLVRQFYVRHFHVQHFQRPPMCQYDRLKRVPSSLAKTGDYRLGFYPSGRLCPPFVTYWQCRAGGDSVEQPTSTSRQTAQCRRTADECCASCWSEMRWTCCRAGSSSRWLGCRTCQSCPCRTRIRAAATAPRPMWTFDLLLSSSESLQQRTVNGTISS